MDLVKGDLVPIKAIPEAHLNAKILNDLTPWLTQLLSIKATDENVERLEVLLPMVKDNCWSMPIWEIKKAFTMYVQGKLPIEPRDNYLTAILFSKVIQAYKEQKPREPEAPIQVEMKASDTLEVAKQNVMDAYDKYKIYNSVHWEYAPAFDRLLEWGFLKEGEKYDKYYNNKLVIAGGYVNAEIIDLWNFKKKCGVSAKECEHGRNVARSELNSMGVKHPKVQRKFRCLVLEDYFKKITRKELINKLNGIS